MKQWQNVRILVKYCQKFREIAKNSQKWPKRTIVNSECGNFRIIVPLRFLREINFGNSRSAKSAISTHLEALNVDFCEFWHVLKVGILPNCKIQRPQMAISTDLNFYDP